MTLILMIFVFSLSANAGRGDSTASAMGATRGNAEPSLGFCNQAIRDLRGHFAVSENDYFSEVTEPKINRLQVHATGVYDNRKYLGGMDGRSHGEFDAKFKMFRNKGHCKLDSIKVNFKPTRNRVDSPAYSLDLNRTDCNNIISQSGTDTVDPSWLEVKSDGKPNSDFIENMVVAAKTYCKLALRESPSEGLYSAPNGYKDPTGNSMADFAFSQPGGCSSQECAREKRTGFWKWLLGE